MLPPARGLRPLDRRADRRRDGAPHRARELLARDGAPAPGRERAQTLAREDVARPEDRWRVRRPHGGVLDLYAELPDPARPVICLDESPVQLMGEVREPIAASAGQIERVDYEYRRNG